MNLCSRRTFLGSLLAHIGLIGGSGCGTILYPERRGQPAGPLDWKIVALDTVGLLLFFVPGVIAFAVDFGTGAIYLPANHYGRKRPEGDSDSLVTIPMPDERLSLKVLEEIATRHAGHDVQLISGRYRTEELASLDDFWEAAERLAAV